MSRVRGFSIGIYVFIYLILHKSKATERGFSVFMCSYDITIKCGIFHEYRVPHFCSERFLVTLIESLFGHVVSQIEFPFYAGLIILFRHS